VKNISIILFCLFLCKSISAQNAFYDALLLEQKQATTNPKFREESLDTVYAILSNYVPDHIKNDRAKIESEFSGNPYMGYLLPGEPQTSPEMKRWLAQSFSPVGGLDITTFADGIGKFLADRTKEEINIAFFEKFRDLLLAYPELNHMFPSTHKYLGVVSAYEYSNMLTTLRQAFERDLKNLVHNMASLSSLKISDCDKCKTQKQKSACRNRVSVIKKSFETQAGQATAAALLITDGVINKLNPADIIRHIGNNEAIVNGHTDLGNILELLGILSESIRHADANQNWVSKVEFASLSSNSTARHIYLGLVYQKIKSCEIKIADRDISGLLDTAKTSNNKLIVYLNKFIELGTTLQSSYTKAQNDTIGSTESKIKSTIAALKSLSDFTGVAVNFKDVNPNIAYLPKHINYVFTLTSGGLEITQNILDKNYSAAVLSSLLMVDSILQTEKYQTVKGKINVSGDLEDTTLVNINFKRNFLRYGTFFANVIKAENSDDVKKAIQSVALPPGSSSIKKTTNFNISLQAYTGFSGGREIANLKTPASQGVFFNALSVYAPVGIAFSTGLKSHKNPANKYNAGSLTAMFSIIDVGAIFAYRFKDPGSTLGDSVKIRLENIFAPGANIIYGIPKVPLSIGTGLQWQPSLTRLTNTNATVTNNSGVRWQLFLVFDLSVLNLYSSKK
jgi:hypothetical protein